MEKYKQPLESNIEAVKAAATKAFFTAMMAFGFAGYLEATPPSSASFENYSAMQSQGKELSMKIRQQIDDQKIDTIRYNEKYTTADGRQGVMKVKVFENGPALSYIESDSASGASLLVQDEHGDGVVSNMTLTYAGKTADEGKTDNSKPNTEFKFIQDGSEMAKTKVVTNVDLSKPFTESMKQFPPEEIKRLQEIMVFDHANRKFLAGLSTALGEAKVTQPETASLN